jgi:predicted dehydrogenase
MNIGIVGSSGIARRHLSVLCREPNVHIVGHVTTGWETAHAAAQEWGGRPYVDYRQLLDAERLDAVWICVPPNAHGPLELALLERGISMFVEKPLSRDGPTAQRIRDALAESRSIAAVGYHWRALDTLPEVQSLVAANPVKMALGFWLDATPPPLWWRHQAESGGQLVEQATHVVDLARFLIADGTPVAASAVVHSRLAYPDSDVADVSSAMVRFGRDAIGVFAATCALSHQAAAELQLICEGLFIRITQSGTAFQQGEQRWESRVQEDPFVIENRAFLQALEQQDPSRLICSYEDALATHLLCYSLQLMAENSSQ